MGNTPAGRAEDATKRGGERTEQNGPHGCHQHPRMKKGNTPLREAKPSEVMWSNK